LKDRWSEQNRVAESMKATLARASATLTKVATMEAVERFKELRVKLDTLEAVQRFKEITGRRWRETVDSGRLEIASRICGAAAEELGIEPPRAIKFFREAKHGEAYDFLTERGILGLTSGDSVWLNECLTGNQMVETAAHEVKHLAQPPSNSDKSDISTNERPISSRGVSRLGSEHMDSKTQQAEIKRR
jgi:hypothetical protein